MTLGERIRMARQEAGLSQRQLAGDMMTRNMLSALEHDGANPSVTTLRYLAEKLNKPISYLLGEDVISGQEASKMERARIAYRAGEYGKCVEYTKEIAGLLAAEAMFLGSLALLELAEQALVEGRIPYAKELLEQARAAGEGTLYFSAIQRKWILLMARTDGGRSLNQLTHEDEALVLRAGWALENGKTAQAEALLEAAESRDENWQYLRGEVHFRRKEYEMAAQCYRRVEDSLPRQTRERLEICYRELEDYKMAYYYATKKS